MKHLIRFILLTASRDKLFIGTLCLLLLTISLGAIFGYTSVIEEVQTTTAIITGATSYIIIFGMITFISFHVKSSYENKEIELFLTKPITRTRFLAAYTVGYLITALYIIAPLLVTLIALKSVGMLFGTTRDYLFWGATIYMETALICIFTIFASLILKSAVIAVLTASGFFIFSKVIGVMLVIINNPYAMGVNYSLGLYTKKMMHALTYAFPRLDMFGKSEWLIYGVAQLQYGLSELLFTTITYSLVIFGMMVYDFNRQEF